MRPLRVIAVGSIVVIGIVSGLFFTLVNGTEPREPQLSARVRHGTIAAGGRPRSYLLFAPKALRKGAALVLALHGSGENGARLRLETGYAFDRLADRSGFAVAYPDAFEGYWNACNRVGDYSANRLEIDDVGFLSALAAKLSRELGSDPARVYAVGASRGGHMAYRLAIEAPRRFRAVAAVSASMPVPANSRCRPAGPGTASVLIMNGTEDPLNPFLGGEVALYGLFMHRGRVLSSHATAGYFAGAEGLGGRPATRLTEVADGIKVERMLWRGKSREVESDAIVGGGHAFPQRWYRGPRLLGPTPREPNAAEVIWEFFARQR
jgi:polyhydroxybutyrate depolymerase